MDWVTIVTATVAAAPGLIGALIALSRSRDNGGQTKRLGVSYGDLLKRVAELEQQVRDLRSELSATRTRERELISENLELRRQLAG